MSTTLSRVTRSRRSPSWPASSPPSTHERAPGIPVKEVLDDVARWRVAGHRVAVERAVVTEALAVLAGEKPRGVVTFGYSDDEAFAVGLTCGGTVHLYVEPLDW